MRSATTWSTSSSPRSREPERDQMSPRGGNGTVRPGRGPSGGTVELGAPYPGARAGCHGGDGQVSPILKYCSKHGTYKPGNPPVPRGGCPTCARDYMRKDSARRRRPASGSHHGGDSPARRCSPATATAASSAADHEPGHARSAPTTSTLSPIPTRPTGSTKTGSSPSARHVTAGRTGPAAGMSIHLDSVHRMITRPLQNTTF
jgi:hypothetical protein